MAAAVLLRIRDELGAIDRVLGPRRALSEPPLGLHGTAAVIAVAMEPGCTELTRMPYFPRSTAAAFVSPRTPNFVATEPADSGSAISPWADEMSTIDSRRPSSSQERRPGCR
jgi:hypothetical protein